MTSGRYLDALQRCDDALGFVEDVRHELAAAGRELPIEAANMRAFLSKTLDALQVVETRLHTASNHIRRAA